MIDRVRSMVGFEWSPRMGQAPVFGTGEDGWCVRDAICELLGWEPGSDEWLRFEESVAGPDIPRLFNHLELRDLNPQAPASWRALLALIPMPRSLS
jgi:hypothetical protein